MKLFTAPRGCGKTNIAAKMCIEIDAYLVVRNRREAQRVFEIYKDKGLRFPITYDEILKYPMKQAFLKKVVVDNVEDFAYHVLSNQCGASPIMGTIDQDFMNMQDISRLAEIEKEKNAEQEHKRAKEMKRRVQFEKDMRMVNFMMNKIEENKE